MQLLLLINSLLILALILGLFSYVRKQRLRMIQAFNHLKLEWEEKAGGASFPGSAHHARLQQSIRRRWRKRAVARLKKDEASDQLAEITLVIPTHNRHSRLERSLSYYGRWNIKILVLDSTSVPYAKGIPGLVNYLHLPTLTFAEKASHAMSLVDTPYVLFSADDDFISVKGVLGALAYMRSNPGCASAQGWHAGFVIKNRMPCWSAGHLFAKSYRVKGENAAQRLAQQSTLYMNNFYALQRTAAAKDCFCRVLPAIPKEVFIRRPDLIEMGQAFCSVVWGDHVVLPMFWIGREAMAASLGHSASPHDDALQRSDFLMVLAKLGETLKEHFEEADASRCFEEAGQKIEQYGKSWYAGKIPNAGPVEVFMRKSSDLGALALMDDCIRKHVALYD
ncbi:MAG: TIGR00180 family glycosyltransferase [Prosthecobacter sp.]|jgi:glycosyltransferase domain-containing protein